MAVEWFCQVMGSEVGPMNQLQLVEMVRNHQLNPEDLVRCGNSTWVPAFEVKGLFEAASKPRVVPEPKLARKRQSPATVVVAPDGKRATAVEGTVEDSGTAARGSEVDDVADWFCIASGEKLGPLGFDELKRLAADGELRDKDRVWRGSWPKFQQAQQVDGLGFDG